MPLQKTHSALLFAVIALALAGCATPAPEKERGESSPSPSASPSLAVTPAPTPVALTCENLVTTAALTRLTSNGSQFFPEFGERIRKEPNDLNLFFDYGGIACQWGIPNSDAGLVLAGSPMTTAQAATQRARLTADGWTSGRLPDGRENWTKSYPDGPNDYEEIYIFETGSWKFALDTSAVDFFAR